MATALELTREGWQHNLEAARRRPEPLAPFPSVQKERERLLDLVRTAAAELKIRFGVRRVFLCVPGHMLKKRQKIRMFTWTLRH